MLKKPELKLQPEHPENPNLVQRSQFKPGSFHRDPGFAFQARLEDAAAARPMEGDCIGHRAWLDPLPMGLFAHLAGRIGMWKRGRAVRAASRARRLAVRGEWALRAWLVFWAVAAVAHVTQGIWASGWAMIPGDGLDGRFNNLVLEHGYQAMRGWADWLSPGQYFPSEHTLGMSDTHAGTVLFYSLARLAGASVEHAFQLWFVWVAVLNVWAFARVLRAVEVPVLLMGPLLYLGVSPAIMVWEAGTHMQLLPVFPALFALGEGLRFMRDGFRWRLGVAAGWWCWQFAASPYVGFYAAVFGGIGVVLSFVLARPSGGRKQGDVGPADGGWWRSGQRLVAAGIVLAGVVLFTLSAVAYLEAMRLGVERPLSELRELAPDWRSWIAAVPGHAWYPPGWPGRGSAEVEKVLFSGFGPWIGMVGAALVGFRFRENPAGRVALLCSLTAVSGLLFFTAWGMDSGFTLLAERVGFLRAFRASGRSIVVVHALQVVGLAAAMTVLWRRREGRCGIGLAWTTLAVLLAAETVTVSQPSVPAEAMRMRREAVVEAWRQAGDRPVLLFAPGFSNQSDQLCQLDAFAAALQLRRKTVNGYSGDVPGSHVTFVHTPTAENGRALMAALGLDPAQISFVESWAEPYRSRLGIVQTSGRPVSRLDGFDLQPVGWNLFAALEQFEVEGRRVYQFTPPAYVLFRLPDDASGFEVWQGFRPGSYERADQSDGVEIAWVVIAEDGRETDAWRRYLNPRDVPEDRGLKRISAAFPPGQGRLLKLVIDVGPANSNAWDWVVFSGLKVIR